MCPQVDNDFLSWDKKLCLSDSERDLKAVPGDIPGYLAAPGGRDFRAYRL